MSTVFMIKLDSAVIIAADGRVCLGDGRVLTETYEKIVSGMLLHPDKLHPGMAMAWGATGEVILIDALKKKFTHGLTEIFHKHAKDAAFEFDMVMVEGLIKEIMEPYHKQLLNGESGFEMLLVLNKNIYYLDCNLVPLEVSQRCVSIGEGGDLTLGYAWGMLNGLKGTGPDLIQLVDESHAAAREDNDPVKFQVFKKHLRQLVSICGPATTMGHHVYTSVGSRVVVIVLTLDPTDCSPADLTADDIEIITKGV